MAGQVDIFVRESKLIVPEIPAEKRNFFRYQLLNAYPEAEPFSGKEQAIHTLVHGLGPSRQRFGHGRADFPPYVAVA